jgi:hypothetical protein
MAFPRRSPRKVGGHATAPKPWWQAATVAVNWHMGGSKRKSGEVASAHDECLLELRTTQKRKVDGATYSNHSLYSNV